MRRREFMTAMAGAGAGIALAARGRANGQAPDEESAQPRSPNDKIQVALIGARNMGGNSHLPTLVGAAECELVAVCDVDRKILAGAIEKAKKRYAEDGQHRDIAAYGDYREVLRRSDVDAVVIAAPDHWHVPMAKAAVLAGKDVYVEKPLSLCVAEGRELATLARERKAMVQVGSQQRSDDRFFLSAAAAQSGMLGDIRHVEVGITTRPGTGDAWTPQPVPPELDYDRWLGPAPWTDYHSERVHYNFRFVPDFSGGDITNWGAHYLDSAQQALGMDRTGPVTAQGSGKRHPAGSLHSTFYDVEVDYAYANGITLKLKSGGPIGVRLVGSEASLFVARGKLELDPPNLLRALPKEEAKKLRKTKGSHMQNWFACIRSRRAADLHAPLEIGHRSATVCHMANIAIELGRPLRWDPEREIFVDDAHANALCNRPVRQT